MQYEVITPIRHDGARYNPGEKVELPKDLAETLLRDGAIKAIHAPFSQARREIKLNLES